ncbi:MAG: choice-of-anchor tandem repeat NxxGxxAF-containing protein, partial [Myxococcota bacterium]
MPNRTALARTACAAPLFLWIVALAIALPARAQPVAIAFEGDPEPGGSGGTFFQLGPPVVNDAGVVAFRSTISSGSANQGIYRDAGGGVAAIALQGALAPDTGGGIFTSFGDPAINASGDVVFTATVGGGSANAGIWQSTPAGLLTIVTTQVSAPG